MTAFDANWKLHEKELIAAPDVSEAALAFLRAFLLTSQSLRPIRVPPIEWEKFETRPPPSSCPSNAFWAR